MGETSNPHGPAVIQVILDTSKARRQVADLGERLKKESEASKTVRANAERVEHAANRVALKTQQSQRESRVAQLLKMNVAGVPSSFGSLLASTLGLGTSVAALYAAKEAAPFFAGLVGTGGAGTSAAPAFGDLAQGIRELRMLYDSLANKLSSYMGGIQGADQMMRAQAIVGRTPDVGQTNFFYDVFRRKAEAEGIVTSAYERLEGEARGKAIGTMIRKAAEESSFLQRMKENFDLGVQKTGDGVAWIMNEVDNLFSGGRRR